MSPFRAPLLALAIAALPACGARSDLDSAAAPADAGCAPTPCASGNHWDPATCACAVDPCPPSDGAVTLATISAPSAWGGAITVRGGRVYWTTRAGEQSTWMDGVVSSIDRCGGPVTTLATGQVGPNAIATDGEIVVWGNDGWSNGAPGGNPGVWSVPVGGGAPASIAAEPMYAGGVAVDASDVLWTGASLDGVFAAPKAGGAATALVSGQSFNRVVVDASHAYLLQAAGIQGLGHIVRVPLGGGAPQAVVATLLGFPGVLALDDAHLYYVTVSGSGGAALTRAVKDGSSPTDLAPVAADAIASDGLNVYFARDNDGSGATALVRVPVEGGEPVVLAKEGISDLAVDDAYVYWLSGPDLRRMPK